MVDEDEDDDDDGDDSHAGSGGSSSSFAAASFFSDIEPLPLDLSPFSLSDQTIKSCLAALEKRRRWRCDSIDWWSSR